MDTTRETPSLVSWNQVLAVWWSFIWRGMMYGLLIGFALGAAAGVYAVAIGQPEKGVLYGAFAGWLATIPASLIAMKKALSKHLALLAAEVQG